MSKFKFLHISDLHFGHFANRPPLLPFRFNKEYQDLVNNARSKEVYVASHTKGKTDALSTFIYEECNDVDCIAVTGDIATTGHYNDINVAFEFFEGDPNLEIEELDNSLKEYKDKIILLPGNHDRFIQQREVSQKANFLGSIKKTLNMLYFPDGKYFDFKFNHFYQPIERVTERILQKDSLTIGVFTADFTLESKYDAGIGLLKYINMLARGKVHKNTLKNLAERTNEFNQNKDFQNKVVIWLVHFPPVFPKKYYLDVEGAFPKILDVKLLHYWKKYTSKLVNAPKLIKAAKNNKVSMILSGHLHEPFAHEINSKLKIYGTGSTTEHTFSEYVKETYNKDLGEELTEENSFHLFSFEIKENILLGKRICYYFNHLNSAYEKKNTEKFQIQL